MQDYKPQTFPNLTGLKIPQPQIDEHLKLYNGYVTNVNALNKILTERISEQNFDGPEFSESVRRLGFEYNGLKLHELYFANLNAKGGDEKKAKKLLTLINNDFESFEKFKNYFIKVAAMRGIGWVILYQDNQTKQLSVHWISDHENGHPAGFTPIIVLDVWEHAWTVYLKPTERVKYLEDFMMNLDWSVCESRLV